MQQQQQDYVAEVYSKQLAKKMKAPPVQQQSMDDFNVGGPPAPAMMAAPSPGRAGGAPSLRGDFANLQQRARASYPARRRPKTDTLFRWNALPNEYIVPLGSGKREPVLGGSVHKWRARGVLRFPSSVQRIVFRTDNISAENQGVMVEGWACWRVSEPGLAVEKLDFSDPHEPMTHTCKILGIEAAGIMKGLISVKAVADLLKRREDLIDSLRKKLEPTEKRWGISFDEIGISEVQVLSQEVFENLQRPFRNEAREVASTSDLETEERIAERTAAQRERVTKMESESAQRMSELQAKSSTHEQEIELQEEKKRILAEQQVQNLRLEEKKRIEALKRKLDAELELERKRAETEAEIARIETEREQAIKALQARDARELEAMRLRAEREQAALEGEQAIEAAKKQRALQQIETARAVAEAEQTATEAAQLAELASKHRELESWAERRRLSLEVTAATDAHRLDVAEKERAIAGQLTETEVRARMIAALPEIASSIKIGDVRWYGGAEGNQGPHGLIARSIEQVLQVAEEHGVDVKAMLPAKKKKTSRAS
ncbi:MAG: SPFH domain-containing protein [Planctomycetota bacterium]